MATKPKKRNKKITLEEFKAWLEGISEMHPQNWVPSLEQWTAIKEKIYSITTTETQKKKISYDDLDDELKKMISMTQQPQIQPATQPQPPYIAPQEINPYTNSAISQPIQDEIVQSAISDNVGGIEGEVQTGDIQQGPYKSEFI